MDNSKSKPNTLTNQLTRNNQNITLQNPQTKRNGNMKHNPLEKSYLIFYSRLTCKNAAAFIADRSFLKQN